VEGVGVGEVKVQEERTMGEKNGEMNRDSIG
jgi:hypothetical protein